MSRLADVRENSRLIKSAGKRRKTMDELKELFAEGALTAEEFEAKVSEKGYKLANLAGGGYVDKKKFDRLQSDFDKYKADEASKYAGYEDVIKERDGLLAEKKERELIEKVAAAKVGGGFQKFVLREVQDLVKDDVSFEDALAGYLKKNPQFIEEAKPSSIIRIPSQLAGDKGAGGEQSENKKMNEMIRGAFKRK